MLSITINAVELFDEASQEFIATDEVTLNLEHSLVSLSKWESFWEKPFLSDKEKTDEETIDYIKCMTLNEAVSPDVYLRLSNNNIQEISKYIDAKMSATWFNESNMRSGAPNREVITSEIIYYWMISLNVPFECQYWHLNRLLTLIKVCNHKNAPAKKMGRQELNARNRALNEARKAQLNTNG